MAQDPPGHDPWQNRIVLAGLVGVILIVTVGVVWIALSGKEVQAGFFAIITGIGTGLLMVSNRRPPWTYRGDQPPEARPSRRG